MLRPNEQAQHRVFAASHLLATARVISFAVTANYRYLTPPSQQIFTLRFLHQACGHGSSLQ
jgi:hypothetical protein